MRTATRRQMVAGTAAAGVFWIGRPGRAAAAEFVLKFANPTSADHPVNLRAQTMADAVRQETGGRVDIQVYPASQLGGESELLSQLRSGAIELMTLSGLILSTMVPVSAINGIGFAFTSYDEVWAAMDGDLGAYVRKSISQVGLHPFERMFDNGFRQITSSNKPIDGPADLRGFKLRVPVSPLLISLFRALGAAPTGINFAETYSALQTRIVDGQENPLTIIDVEKLYEVQKYCTLTNHIWDGWWMVANGQAWAQLPADLQAIVGRHITGAALAEREDVRQANARVEDRLKARGMVFNQPDPGPFRAALVKAKFYAEWRAKYGEEAWSALERYAGRLG